MDNNHPDWKLFTHHIYMLKKGVRDLTLYTASSDDRNYIEERIQKSGFDFYTRALSNNRVNVYFGAEQCVKIIRSWNKQVGKLSPEEDFILGTMLGYDIKQNCERYNKKRTLEDEIQE